MSDLRVAPISMLQGLQNYAIMLGCCAIFLYSLALLEIFT